MRVGPNEALACGTTPNREAGGGRVDVWRPSSLLTTRRGVGSPPPGCSREVRRPTFLADTAPTFQRPPFERSYFDFETSPETWWGVVTLWVRRFAGRRGLDWAKSWSTVTGDWSCRNRGRRVATFSPTRRFALSRSELRPDLTTGSSSFRWAAASTDCSSHSSWPARCRPWRAWWWRDSRSDASDDRTRLSASYPSLRNLWGTARWWRPDAWREQHRKAEPETMKWFCKFTIGFLADQLYVLQIQINQLNQGCLFFPSVCQITIVKNHPSHHPLKWIFLRTSIHFQNVWNKKN